MRQREAKVKAIMDICFCITMVSLTSMGVILMIRGTIRMLS